MKILINIGLIILVSFSIRVQAQLENLKYDVDLELHHFEIRNVKDLDGTEDLFGDLYCSWKANIKQGYPDWKFWDYSGSEARAYKNGTKSINIRRTIVYNLSLEELKHFELSINGTLMDAEGLFPAIRFKCVECSENSNITRLLKFPDMSTTLNSIEDLRNNGQYQQLKFGNDNYFELNFYENGNKNNGWVKVMWKVWVKPHL